MTNIPGVQFEDVDDGKIFRSVPTYLTQQPQIASQPAPWQNESLPELTPLPTDENKIMKAMGARIRRYAIPHPDGDLKRFWPPILLNHLVDKPTLRQLVRVLVKQNLLYAEDIKLIEDAERKWTNLIWSNGQQGHGFRGLLALLILIGKQDSIQDFIHRGVHDGRIPLDGREDIFLDWDGHQIDGFYRDQWGLRVPFFASSKERGKACRVVLHKNDIEPWYQSASTVQQNQSSRSTTLRPSTSMTAQLKSMALGGGYGEVSQIFIHPWQHDFHGSIASVSAHETHFALKSLFSREKSVFEREADMLERFSGHPNIITLLAAITCEKGLGREEYHLLFPWAEGDLLAYWMQDAKPRKTHQNVMWMSSQIHGIVEAVDFIHNPQPRMLNKNEEVLYGRHGDIKPENVLWFDRGGSRVLVISDLGLSAIHREKSRSNVPGYKIPATPNYRPPECDMAGREGHISRSFDIWTLGCLFLEFVVWSLEGWVGRQKFRSQRFSPYITAAEEDVFFDVVAIEGEANKYAFKIKDKVYQQICGIHEHPDCTRYIHDLVDIIKTRMLILESDEPRVKRIRAAELLLEIEELKKRCSDKAYCLTKCPEASTHEPYPPVTAALNEVALEAIGNNGMHDRMDRFGGAARSAYVRKKSL